MERYDSYKDSGVEWLGQVPSHWEVKRLSAYFDRRNQKVSELDYAPLSVTKNGIVPQMENVAKSNDTENRRLVKVNDFVINSRSDRKGSSGVSTLEGSVSFVNTVMIPRKTIVPQFCNYLLKSNDFVEENYRNGHGIVADLWTTAFDDQKFISLAMPPIKEQESIVAYLDKAVGAIDEAIAAQQKMIDLLNERKQIIITRAVTRGLNPDVKLKDSGNDWLDQIPEHWDAIPVRHFFEFKNGYTPSKANPSFWTNGTIPWFRMEDIRKSGRILEKAIQYVTPSAVNNGGTFDAGSFILAICTASIGEHAMLIADSLANQRFANLKIRKSLSNRTMPMFIFYYLYILGRYCKDTANTTTFQYADMNLVENFKVPLPSPEEQQMIVDYLEHNFKGIEKAIEQHKNMISLLQERKQIIISEVVTGKVKVS